MPSLFGISKHIAMCPTANNKYTAFTVYVWLIVTGFVKTVPNRALYYFHLKYFRHPLVLWLPFGGL